MGRPILNTPGDAAMLSEIDTLEYVLQEFDEMLNCTPQTPCCVREFREWLTEEIQAARERFEDMG